MDIFSGAVSGQARPINNERRSGLLTILRKTLKLEPWSIAKWASIDANGSLSQSGAFAEGTQGSYTLMVQTGGKMSNTISFVVSNCP